MRGGKIFEIPSLLGTMARRVKEPGDYFYSSLVCLCGASATSQHGDNCGEYSMNNEQATATIAVRHMQISATSSGQRLDNFLLRELKGAPRSLIYRLLRSGQVRVNGGRAKPEQRLQSGDVVRIPPLRLGALPTDNLPLPAPQLERVRDAVIYEDAELLVLNKPSGLAVHKGSGLAYGIIELLRHLRPHEPFLELAHRLDRQTSGCLVLARTPNALRQIQQGLRSGQVEKRYLALVRGQWQHGVYVVQQALRRNMLRGGERMVEAVADGKPAVTTFRPVHLHPQASLLEAQIATGRTHQIRVHAAHVGHALAGDEKYGDHGFNRWLAQHCGLRRLFLHAHSVQLALGGREIAVSAPLDAELKAVLQRVQHSRQRS